MKETEGVLKQKAEERKAMEEAQAKIIEEKNAIFAVLQVPLLPIQLEAAEMR